MQSEQILALSACCHGHYESHIGGQGGGMNSNEATRSLAAAQAGSLEGNRFAGWPRLRVQLVEAPVDAPH